ncbi:MAG TPA: nuclear transport factor 2 family protein [Roseomonas sp.]|jgi:hypothetical protein
MTSPQKPTKDAILALETAYWDAMKAKDGRRTAALSGAVSLVTGVHGVMRIPQDRMGKMTEDGDWSLDSFEFDDVEVSSPTADVAIIAYTVRQTMTMKGKQQTLKAADSSTWIRGQDGWQCHAHSETFLKDQAQG